MKTAEINQIIASNPDAVFRIKGSRDYVVIDGVTADHKALTRSINPWTGDVSGWKGKTSIRMVTNHTDENPAALAERMQQMRQAQKERQAAEAKARAAKEAAKAKAADALKGRHDDVIAGLASILGCKRDDIEINEHRGEVTITLAGDVAVNIVEERAYAY